MEMAAAGAASVAIGNTALAGGSLAGQEDRATKSRVLDIGKFAFPVALSTWKHGVLANRGAMEVLRQGGSVLDAVEKGINLVELDPTVDSVGLGGLPNEAGDVELDAAIMAGDLRCGAVMALRHVATAISVARRVMERTRHIQLVGAGALQFAMEQGFKRQDLLTPASRAAWEKWKSTPGRPVPGQVEKSAPEKPSPAKENQDGGGHDTVSTIVLGGRDGSGGRMAAGSSTSGLAWKLAGRVGDSPIVGAGLYCDGAVGAAAATGIGEEILRVSGSFLIVEGMRRGLGPAAAIAEALERMANAQPGNRQRQVAFIALSRTGEAAAGAMRSGFQVAIAAGDGKEDLLNVLGYGE